MNYWIIPSNLEKFDVIGAFNLKQDIYWKQSVNISVGDFVLIYISKPIQQIRFLCEVLETDLNYNPEPLTQFIKDGAPFVNYPRFMKIRKIRNIIDLGLATLHDLGVNGSFQSQFKANNNLIKYIDNNYQYWNEENLIEANKPRITNELDWTKVLENEYKLYRQGKASFYHEIQTMIKNGITSSIANELASILNLDYQALNGKIAGLGKRIVKLLELKGQSRANKEIRYWNIIFTGKLFQDGLIEYSIRKELVDAFEIFINKKEIMIQSEFENQFSSQYASKEDFNDFINPIIAEHNKLEELRQKFVNKFTKEKIRSLKIEEYALGRMETNKDSNSQTFCYQLETTLKGLGNIQGATASKFGLYYEKSSGKVMITNKLGKDENESIKIIRSRIIDLLEAGSKLDYKIISNSELSPMFKGKILSTYYPEKFLPVFNEVHIDKLINYLGLIYNPKVINNLELKKKLIVDQFISKHYYFKNNPLHYFVAFLYQPFVKQQFLKLEDEIVQVDTSETQEKFFDYMGKKEFKSRDIKRSVYKPDYLKIQLSKMKAGSLAEEHVVEYEKNRLKKAGLDYLAQKVNRVSITNDSLGYDIESYDHKTKQRIFIEVKSRKYFNDDISFFITKNELENWDNPNFRIYYVFYENNKAYVHELKKDEIKKEDFESVLLRLDMKVKMK